MEGGGAWGRALATSAITVCNTTIQVSRRDERRPLSLRFDSLHVQARFLVSFGKNPLSCTKRKEWHSPQSPSFGMLVRRDLPADV